MFKRLLVASELVGICDAPVSTALNPLSTPLFIDFSYLI